ncbi:unnamed protein product [Mytilus coruscus]|uniref:Integrase catalytic domain-containing protein n=1 Tax=Mytilus coruscus TaxID=42192 RepID=A0A6J8EBF0_MYTCO|nr:unnamed protein product [Mytilus coruscus]
MDILSGLPTTPDKYKHVLLVVDSYSKRSEIFPLRTQEAGEVAGIRYREIISRYGAPRVLISDRGRNFTSNLVKALSEIFQITRHLTSSYHPQSNGSVERMNSVILQSIRSYAKDQQDDWVYLLPGIMMTYRATPATQLKPYYDPNTRPTNPPSEHENDEDELDPDEIGQQDNNDRQQNRGQQNGDNNNRQQQNRRQRNDDNNDRGQRNDNNNDRLQPNRDQTIEDNNNQNQPQNPPVGNTKPSCQDCKRRKH